MQARPSPKRIAIFCDGTWNDLRTSHLTNVARLAKCVAPIDPASGMQQIVYYDEGVGVSSNISKTTDSLVKLAGGALGRGLDRKVEAAYRFLVLNYEPDDEIFVFGFSRGAYTARSLCGLIRKCGIVRRDCFEQVPNAVLLYRNELHPREPKVMEFRQRFSHTRSAGREDEGWVAENVRDSPPTPIPGENNRAWLFQHRQDYSYRMMFLGVWDTVGSLGVPARFGPLTWLNNKYRFHDTELSGLLASVRHAVAIEEDRRVFDSAGMSNINELNVEWAHSAASKRNQTWEVINPDEPNFVPYNHRPYQQVWFPGGHGAVGGGNPALGLPSATLLWVAEGACWAGLAFSKNPRSELHMAVARVNPTAAWHVDKKGQPKRKNAFDLLGAIGGRRLRKGPDNLEEVGMTAILRWHAKRKWRPKNMDVLHQYPFPPAPMADAPPGFPPEPQCCAPVPQCYPRKGAPRAAPPASTADAPPETGPAPPDDAAVAVKVVEDWLVTGDVKVQMPTITGLPDRQKKPDVN